MQDSRDKLVISICLIYTLLQFILLAIFGYTPYPDSEGYQILADDTLSAHEPYPASSQLYNLSFIWNVGAINAVALSKFLFHSILPLLLLYSLFQGLTSWLLYHITAHLINKSVAFITLCLYVLYPANYGQGTSLLSETPFIFFILLAVWLALCCRQWLLCGILLAIANWFRPMGLIFILAFIIYKLFNKKEVRIIPLITGYAIVILCISSFTMYRIKTPVYQAQTGWMSLLQYSVDHTSDTTDNSLPVINHNMNVIQKDAYWRDKFLEWLPQHTTDYLTQIPTKLLKTFETDNINFCTYLPQKKQRKYMYEEISMYTIMQQFPHLSGLQVLVILNLFYYYFLLITALIGTIQAIRSKKFNVVVLPVTIILISCLFIMFFGHGEARFHQMFMQFIIMLSACFILTKIPRRYFE